MTETELDSVKRLLIAQIRIRDAARQQMISASREYALAEARLIELAGPDHARAWLDELVVYHGALRTRAPYDAPRLIALPEDRRAWPRDVYLKWKEIHEDAPTISTDTGGDYPA